MPSLNFLVYRYRFLVLYTVFGFISLTVELLINHALQSFKLPYPFSILIGFISGVLVAFVLNIRFNFHIAPTKRKRALFYFIAISFISFCYQFFIRRELLSEGVSMDVSRFLTAGFFFILSYFIHRRLTFKEYKKVGVAIYADGVEDIKKIYNKISNVCDFIHVDIVDKTFKPDCPDVKAYRAEVVRAYWQKKPIEVHIMSKTPSVWLPDLLPYVDIIYVHMNINEDIKQVFSTIREAGCKPGIVVSVSDDINNVYQYLPEISNVLLLAIKNPGYSGQKFDMEILSFIEMLDRYKERNKFAICVDGGVNNTTIQYLNVDAVVSGSFVLNAEKPVKNIMYLQTSGEYERY